MRGLRKRYRDLQLQRKKESFEIPSDPIEFCIKLFGFYPTPYQEKLLRDPSKRIAVRWSRQAGKTSTIALKAICFALTHSKALPPQAPQTLINRYLSPPSLNLSP